MEFEYVIGDLIKSDEEVIAHGCNCVGVMGAGIALQVARVYPVVEYHYKQAVQRGTFPLGSAQLIHPNGFRRVFNLGTQFQPGRDASLRAVYLSFTNMAETCYVQKIKRVAIPRIGCGIGGLEWDPIVQSDGLVTTPGVEYAITEAIRRSSADDLMVAVYDLP